MPLSDRQIRNADPGEKPRKLADEKGLFLLINPNGSRYWRLKYRIAGKEKLLSLGVYPETSLSAARTQRDEARKLIAQGLDPSALRKSDKQAAPSAIENSFETIAREWHKKNSGRWSSHHAVRILGRLEAELFPTLGKQDIAMLRTQELLACLQKVEDRGSLDLASRLRQHMNGIMRYAVQIGKISSNPAGNLAGALSTRKTVHRAALPLERIPERACPNFCVNGFQVKAE